MDAQARQERSQGPRGGANRGWFLIICLMSLILLISLKHPGWAAQKKPSTQPAAVAPQSLSKSAPARVPKKPHPQRTVTARKPTTKPATATPMSTPRVTARQPDTTRTVSLPTGRRQRVLEGTIHTTLYRAVAAQGENLRIAADLARIFDWDIDFHTDLRQRDTFRLLIEEDYQRGKRPTYQRILAAELVNQGQTYQAVYYAPKGTRGGFYRPDGRAMQRMFLSSPIPYARISSHFSHTRLHPIRKVVCPHLGVDYAAPRGTPVRSVGDGVIEWAGAKGGSGNMIVIRHNTIYRTYYLHLDRFARGIRAGQQVAQGQTIAYVGSTGLSTGPHLDFRLSEHGKFLNPVTHKSFDAAPMSQEVLAVYRLYAQRLLARLEQPAASPTRWVATVR